MAGRRLVTFDTTIVIAVTNNKFHFEPKKAIMISFISTDENILFNGTIWRCILLCDASAFLEGHCAGALSLPPAGAESCGPAGRKAGLRRSITLLRGLSDLGSSVTLALFVCKLLYGL